MDSCNMPISELAAGYVSSQGRRYFELFLTTETFKYWLATFGLGVPFQIPTIFVVRFEP